MNKIAYVLSSYPVLSETFVGTEMRAMEASGHEVQPIAFNHHFGEFQKQDSELKDRTLFLCDYSKLVAIKALPFIRTTAFKALRFAFLQQGISIKSLIGNALKLAYLAKKHQCTHFHAHFSQATAATAIVAARLCGATVSFVGHGYDVYATPQDLTLKLNYVDFVVAVCRDMATDFRNLAPNVDISLIYCGIEKKRFSQPEKKLTDVNHHKNMLGGYESSILEGESDLKRKLLFIGRLCETKGLFTLLRALKMIDVNKRPCLDLVGDGVLRTQLEHYVENNQLGDFVSFLGSKQSTWFIEHSCDYAAMVVPFELAPNGDRDTGPVVVKEAMALKLPVITTYFMGCNEFLTPESGLRVPTKDPVKLSEIIKQFLNMSAEEIQQMKNVAYERVGTFYTSELQASCFSAMIESKNNQ
jgi:glycosyltransferase involved in cell wall biosynthesis